MRKSVVCWSLVALYGLCGQSLSKPAVAQEVIEGPKWKYEGMLIRQDPDSAVFLVLEQKRRHIPNKETLERVFTGKITSAKNIDSIPAGDPISDGACLAHIEGKGEVFLISNGVRRHIYSEKEVEMYHFNLGKKIALPLAVIDAIPEGKAIKWRPPRE